MKIISNHKDYYDLNGIMVDETIIYNRTPTEYFVNIKTFPHLISSYRRDNSNKYFFIGFCGKIYCGLERIKYNARLGYITEYFYGKEIIDSIKFDSDHPYYKKKRLDDCNILLNNFHDKELFLDIFREINAPIFFTWLNSEWSNSFISKNPNEKTHEIGININLKKYEFFRIKDSYTAFQEIQMFISGVLGNIEKDITNMNDKSKIKSKGFDLKWSFRNPNPPLRKQK